MPPGMGESWDPWRQRLRLRLSNPKDLTLCVSFCYSRTRPRPPASAQQASVNGVCTDTESPQVTPLPCAPIRISAPHLAHRLTASCPHSPCWNNRAWSKAASQKDL